MSEIFDAIARISWDSNLKELKQVTDEMKSQDRVLDELRSSGAKLEEQIKKTNDPAKVQRLTGELKKMQSAADSITASQKKQKETTDQLTKSQKALHEQLRKTNDPKQVQQLLRELGKVENQLTSMTTKAQSFSGKVSSFGSSLAMGLGIGGGIGLVMQVLNSVTGFIGGASDEFREATQVANDLERALNNIGKGNLLKGLTDEANTLAAKFNGLFDNDEILRAQQQLVNYGKVSRDELSKLLPVIIELASAEKIDLAAATEKVINILEGRGGQTLRDYGVSIKGVKSEHDRLNVVLGDFAKKLQGASDAYAQTAEGIERKNKLLLKNIQENFGEALDGVQMKILPFLTKILNGINYTFESIDEQFNRRANKSAQSLVDKYAADPEKVKQLGEQALSNARSAVIYKGLADKAQQRLDDALAGKRNPFDEIQARRDVKKYLAEFNKYVEIATAQRRAYNQITGTKDTSPLNPNAKLFDENELPKAAKKTNEELKKPENKIKINVLLGETPIEDLDRPGSNGGSVLARMVEQTAEAAREMKANTDQLNGEIHWAKIHQKLDEIDLTEAKRKEEEERTRIKKEESKKRTEIAKREAWDNTMALIDATQQLIASEQNKTDRLIELQEKRVDAIRSSQDKSAKESLKIEEDRLNELLAKRERYERQQRVIDAAVIVANQAVAISGAVRQIATSKNFAETAANVIAIAAGITASIAAIRNASQEYQFYEGGFTGDGVPEQESTAVGKRPYKYHKGEFVMDHELTAKHKQLFQGLHQRKLKVYQANNGYFVTDTLDVDRAVHDHNKVRSMSLDISGVEDKLDQTNRILMEREVTIYNGFDSGDFATSIATNLSRQQLRYKMAKA